MEILNIPFVSKIGLQKCAEGNLRLLYAEENSNHLKSLHAGAQFTLAETASGNYLQSNFPDLAPVVIPVLRDAQVKYKKPAMKDLKAYVSIKDEVRSKFFTQIGGKGRGLIALDVLLKDSDGITTFEGTFNWFIQKITQNTSISDLKSKILWL